MNRIQLEDKLVILLGSGVVTKDAFHLSLNTFDFISKKLEKEVIENSDMFWTHMSLALTRVERGEYEDGPSNPIMIEVGETPYQKDIEDIITYINSQLDQDLPEGEQAYFYLHLHRVLEFN
ncbi:PRD domain-containing protein [Bacillus changyiensis]|uniref:PRD domain-containing protein n=1 Tax=Bacillus changyiensis TaxID=3004103 RepID=UPI0022E9563C|nr:PRD domain-containing protein [Bacillus changyiensis]MDA1477122.1 PRD domain-containing protein [Bacillus changyiensis]